MIEGELVDPLLADPVDPGIADVGDQGTFGKQEQGRGRGPHPLEVAIGRRTAVDQGADVAKRLDDGLGWRPGARLHIIVRDQVAGHLAGQLADGMGPHSVGDQEDVAALAPRLGMRSPDGRITILIIRTTHPRICPGCVDDGVVPFQ